VDFSKCCTCCGRSMERSKRFQAICRWTISAKYNIKYLGGRTPPSSHSTPLVWPPQPLLLVNPWSARRWCCCRFVTSCGAFDLIYFEFAYLDAPHPRPPLTHRSHAPFAPIAFCIFKHVAYFRTPLHTWVNEIWILNSIFD